MSTIANSIGNGLPATNSSTCSSSITNFPAHETASHCLSASSSSCIAPSVSAGESAAENTSAVFSSSRALSSSKHFTPVANRRQSPRVSRQIRSPKKHLRASGTNFKIYLHYNIFTKMDKKSQAFFAVQRRD